MASTIDSTKEICTKNSDTMDKVSVKRNIDEKDQQASEISPKRAKCEDSAKEQEEAVNTSSEKETKPAISGGFGAFSGGNSFSAFASSTTTSSFGGFANKSKNSSSAFADPFAVGNAFGSSTNAFGKNDKDLDTRTPNEEAAPVFTSAKLEPVGVCNKDYQYVNGEEDEKTILQVRVKLYKLQSGVFTECGIGPMRILEQKSVSEKAEKKDISRVVMRRESYPNGPGTKLILNVRLALSPSVIRKNEKSILFSEIVSVGDKPTHVDFLIRVADVEEADKLYNELKSRCVGKV